MASSSSGTTHNSDLELATKLNKKIKEAEYMKKEKLLKILGTLLKLNMTLDILQKTHIGVTINPLRKVEGKVGETAKQLVKKWKKLLPDKSKAEEQTETKNSIKKSLSPLSAASIGSSTSHHPPLTSRQEHRYLSVEGHSKQGSNSAIPTRSHNATPTRSPKPKPTEMETLSADNNHEISRKRKSDEDAHSIAAALTKRSRTQVYSGKSAGLKYVPSLFDICMNILIDNIDAIEEVGGVPFFILEPVLSKCSPTQLMRLEEFNPHFIEDSDGLWEKHALKEFKGAKPSRGSSWRDLYISKLEERERKMKSITSIIRARQQAREEPVRKATVLDSTPLPPARQRRGFYSRSGPSSSLESSSNTRSVGLMKQTMKMAKNRQMMIASRPKR